MNSELNLIQNLAVWALPVLLAITVREIARAWAAHYLGDDTPAREGRLSLNPFDHVDLVGTIIVPAVLLAIGGFMFGWAKPVPIDFGRMRQPRRDMALVSATGPAVSILMAIAWAVLLRIALFGDAESGIWTGLRYMATAGVSINLILFVLNLLPIPPLDGGRVLMGLLPPRQATMLARVEPYGFFILLGLMVTQLLAPLLSGPYAFIQQLVLSLVGLR